MNTLKETGINFKYGDCYKYDRPGVKDYICCGAVIYNKKYIYIHSIYSSSRLLAQNSPNSWNVLSEEHNKGVFCYVNMLR